MHWWRGGGQDVCRNADVGRCFEAERHTSIPNVSFAYCVSPSPPFRWTLSELVACRLIWLATDTTSGPGPGAPHSSYGSGPPSVPPQSYVISMHVPILARTHIFILRFTFDWFDWLIRYIYVYKNKFTYIHTYIRTYIHTDLSLFVAAACWLNHKLLKMFYGSRRSLRFP